MNEIDSHVHFIDHSLFTYTWTTGRQHLQRTSTAVDYLRDVAQDSASVVLVEADCRPEEATDEALWFQSLDGVAGVHIAAVVASIDLRASDLGERLARYSGEPKITAVRQVMDSRSVDWLLDSRTRTGHDSAGAAGLIVDLCARSQQGAALAEVVERATGTQFVLDHLGKPNVAIAEWDNWRMWFDRITRCDNLLAVKLSGLFDHLPEPFDPNDARRYLDFAIERLSADRLMFGSDWPVVEERGSYLRWRELVGEAISALSANEQQSIMGGTAAKVYRVS